MTLDSQESERLWQTLGQLSAQVQNAHDIAEETALRLERFERTFLHRSEMAARKGARHGARWQALAVSGIVAILSAVGQYLARR